MFNENLWHRDWMGKTRNAYEWWYFDSVSDDGEWSLVVIFLIGSPFSPYTRACELGLDTDPIAHNGVFVALHHRGRLLHYQYSRYAPERIAAIAVGDGSPLLLRFGPSEWREHADSSFVITIDEENANRRRMSARLAFESASEPASKSGEVLSVLDEPGHSWLPVIVGGRAICVIELHSPAETREPERIEFTGSAYHDHNWGTLPFDKSIRQWLWARADFAPGCAAVLYQAASATASSGNTILIVRRPDEPQRILNGESVKVEIMRSVRNGYGAEYPRDITARFEDEAISWRFGRSLESTPFYMRCETQAAWNTPDGVSSPEGRGIGEMLRPRGMGAWLVAQAMRLRIHEPGL